MQAVYIHLGFVEIITHERTCKYHVMYKQTNVSRIFYVYVIKPQAIFTTISNRIPIIRNPKYDYPINILLSNTQSGL